MLQLEMKMRAARRRVVNSAQAVGARALPTVTQAGVAAAADEASELVGAGRDGVSLLDVQHAHMAVDSTEPIIVVDAHVKAIAGTVIGGVRPIGPGNSAGRGGAHRFVPHPIIDAPMLVVAAARACPVPDPVVVHRPAIAVVQRPQRKFVVEHRSDLRRAIVGWR